MTTPATEPVVPHPQDLFEALRHDAGGAVDGAAPGTEEDAPSTDGLSEARAAAVLAAWTGARLHAGLPGLLRTSDADLALLVGDWCFARALQVLARDGDLVAIGRLAAAIGECATALAPEGDDAPPHGTRLAEIWAYACADLRAR